MLTALTILGMMFSAYMTANFGEIAGFFAIMSSLAVVLVAAVGIGGSDGNF